MRFIIYIGIIFCTAACTSPTPELHPGDLLFRAGRNSAMTGAITAATGRIEAPGFSHVGIFVRYDGTDAVLEAAPEGGVRISPLREFLDGSARIGGRPVGLVVGNGKENDGVLTAQSASKAARFIRLCDCYSLPVVSLINSKGVAVPAVDEQAATIKATTQLLYAYAEATTAKVSIVTGNAIGQAYVAMGGKSNADVTYAWPGAVISALTPEAAVQVLYTDDLKADKKPALQSRAELEAKFAADVADGVAAAAAGMVDDVIDPAETRKYVIAALEMLSSKRESNPPKKHGNLPL